MAWTVLKTFEFLVPDGAERPDIEDFAHDCADELRELDKFDGYPVEIDYDDEVYSVLALKLDEEELDATATLVEESNG
jgi:hypothetical protein